MYYYINIYLQKERSSLTQDIEMENVEPPSSASVIPLAAQPSASVIESVQIEGVAREERPLAAHSAPAAPPSASVIEHSMIEHVAGEERPLEAHSAPGAPPSASVIEHSIQIEHVAGEERPLEAPPSAPESQRIPIPDRSCVHGEDTHPIFVAARKLGWTTMMNWEEHNFKIFKMKGSVVGKNSDT